MKKLKFKHFAGLFAVILFANNIYENNLEDGSDKNQKNLPTVLEIKLNDKEQKVRNIVDESMKIVEKYSDLDPKYTTVTRQKAITVVAEAKALCEQKGDDNNYKEELEREVKYILKKNVETYEPYDDMLPASREEIFTIVFYTFFNKSDLSNLKYWEIKSVKEGFNDDNQISPYAFEPIQYLYSKGYIVGADGLIRPNYVIESDEDKYTVLKEGMATAEDVENILSGVVADKMNTNIFQSIVKKFEGTYNNSKPIEKLFFDAAVYGFFASVMSELFGDSIKKTINKFFK